MPGILDNPRFADTYQKLASVSLDPRRHSAASALEHSEAVASRAGSLARANGCTAGEVSLLEDLGRAHDIGKVGVTARPERSLEVLRECGVGEPALLALVKRHDTNLPWFLADSRGQPPSDKAWRRLAAEVELRLLVLFMIADRVDAPPGWRRNAPLAWFLAQARARGLVARLVDPGDAPAEVSAGGAVVREEDGERQLLVIRVRAHGYELPKGGIEWDELPEEASEREVREETGLLSPVRIGGELAPLDYLVGDGDRHLKRVRIFTMRPAGPLELGAMPERTRERRWVAAADLPSLPLVDESLRPLLGAALADQGNSM